MSKNGLGHCFYNQYVALSMNNINHFWGELKRRKVFRVLAFGYRSVKFLAYSSILLNFISVNAQFNENIFNKLLIEIDGEEIYDMSAIAQDHKGYIWMATNLGLIRYNDLEGKK